MISILTTTRPEQHALITPLYDLFLNGFRPMLTACGTWGVLELIVPTMGNVLTREVSHVEELEAVCQEKSRRQYMNR